MKKVPALLYSAAVATLLALPPSVFADTNILSSPWNLNGGPGAKEAYQAVPGNSVSGNSALRLNYDLHGLCLNSNDASAIVFDQNGWKYTSLSKYGENCKNGSQTVDIPLSAFNVDTSKPLDGPFHVRIWADKAFNVDVNSATLVSNGSTTAPSSNTPGSFQGISDGQTVSGKIYVQFSANPDTTKKVDWYIDNNLSQSDTVGPFWLGGYASGKALGWNTSWIPAISHELKVVVTNKDNTTYSSKLNFIVSRSAVTPTPVPAGANITPTPTIRLTPTPTPVPTVPSSSTWDIQSIDSMKSTKDAVCGQRDDAWIGSWLDKAKELGANYVAISMPYDNPSCANSTDYANRWIKLIRQKGLHVWHRRMPLAFEGIYSTPKAGQDFLGQIYSYIKSNSSQFQPGDIFTPIPEPQNGGINGFSSCNGYCQFSSISAFNQWLRDAISRSNQAFNELGISNIKVGYFGFDGFVTWGDNNPDWHGILEDSTVQAMGNVITIDHYPEAIGGNMDTDLSELEAKYPNAKIVIGEWGTITGGSTEQSVINSMGGAKKHKNVVGFNYWQFGPEGSGEQLVNESNGKFSNNVQFDEVQSYYTGKR